MITYFCPTAYTKSPRSDEYPVVWHGQHFPFYLKRTVRFVLTTTYPNKPATRPSNFAASVFALSLATQYS